MRALIRLSLLLAAVATTLACLPVTDLQQTGAPVVTAASAAPVNALKPVSTSTPSPAAESDIEVREVKVTPELQNPPDPPLPTPDDSYPLPPATDTAVPYPNPAGDTEIVVTQQFDETETRLAARWHELDEELLQYLTLAWDSPYQIRPGETHRFAVGLIDCCYVFTEFDVQASWSISPTVGATIDPHTGYFTVDKDTPHGTVYTVTADVENGRASPTIDVYVYTLEENPLIGRWREEKQYSCSDGEEIIPGQDQGIGELQFDADGTFSVTWFPFEVYKDYWGAYSYEKNSAELILFVEDGNYVPDDLDGSGYAVVDGSDHLLLREMWLGMRQFQPNGTNCGHLFVRDQN